MELAANYALSGLIFLLILGTGAWVGLVGRPYNTLLFSLHKLIALGGVIVTGLEIYRTFADVGGEAASLALVALTALSVIALFATGALMSIRRAADRRLLIVHRVAPAVALFSMVGLLSYLAGAGP
jgi:hypothetical protein